MPEDIVLVRADATLNMKEEGQLQVTFSLGFINDTGATKTVKIGYSWRETKKGASNLDSLQIGPYELESCTEKSDTRGVEMPFIDSARWANVEILSGNYEQVLGEIVFELPRGENSASLFGFPDRFAHNLKSFEWSYTKAFEYREIEPAAKPFAVSFETLQAADGSRIRLTGGEEGRTWLRSISHSPWTKTIKDPDSILWILPPKVRPRTVYFEYSPELDREKEIMAFEDLVRTRPNDLRARIHLSDLLRLAERHDQRVEVLADLLEKWNDSAEDQLLTGRNDVRGPAYLALVESLVILGMKDQSRKAAADGLVVLETLDSELETNRLSKLALEMALR